VASEPHRRWQLRRRQPHGNDHSNWRSTRNQRRFAGTDYETQCQEAIAAFLEEQERRNNTKPR